MKKTLLLVLAASLFSAPAYATKARMASLQGAEHLIDSQSIFEYTADLHKLGQFVTLELGTAGNGTAEPKAEGGLFRRGQNGSIYGFYLGHHNEDQADIRSALGVPTQDNPVHAFYGKDNWALNVGLSRSENKTADAKETTVSAGFGKSLNDFSWGVNGELLANAEAGDDEFRGSPRVTGSIRGHGPTYWHGSLSYGVMTFDPAAAGAEDEDIKPMGLEVGYIDRTLGTATTDLYYGLSLAYADFDRESTNITELQLPAVIGLEHTLNSWAVFRGSIRQNILLGTTKDETQADPGDKENSIANNTTVAAGLGLKYAGVTLDGVLAASTSGNVNGDQILARAGVIYQF